MAARAYWQGQIRLALVSIPVDIYTATKRGAQIAFKQIHQPSGKAVHYEKVADDLAEEAYIVLRDALRRSKKVGLGQLAMRGREYVVSLKPCGRGMILETLIACVQMGTIEFHRWGARTSDVEKPDRMVFDLDPDEALGFDEVKRAAADIRAQLADIGLASFAMLSGGKGVHVVVPLAPDAPWPAVKDFASRFSAALAHAEPERFTATMAKAKRKGRIFIDWLRNQRGATAVVPYSVRARPGAPVAVPVDWRELADIGAAHQFSLADADLLIERATAKALTGWGQGAQTLPDI